MNRYIASPQARRDLTEHFVFIAQDKIEPAEKFLAVAEKTFQRIADMPRSGRRWETKKPALAQLRVYPMPSPYRSYLIFYRIADSETVDILAVIHAARNIDPLLDEIISRGGA